MESLEVLVCFFLVILFVVSVVFAVFMTFAMYAFIRSLTRLSDAAADYLDRGNNGV